MDAILLAAGAGRRLESVHRGPKCLLDIGGRTLLDRHLAHLGRLGLARLTVCVGHHATAVEQALASAPASLEVRVVHNPDFHLGSVLTLWHARKALGSGDVLLMDADVLYDFRVLERLALSSHGNCFLLDRAFEAGDEPVKLCVREGRLVEFRKRLDPALQFDLIGESVGFFRLDAPTGALLAECTERFRRDGRDAEPHEEALRELLLEEPGRFGWEDITGLPWIEIDFPEDVMRAATEIAPRIDE